MKLDKKNKYEFTRQINTCLYTRKGWEIQMVYMHKERCCQRKKIETQKEWQVKDRLGEKICSEMN